MCIAFDEERLSGVCGSPTNSLEVFSLSEQQVTALAIVIIDLNPLPLSPSPSLSLPFSPSHSLSLPPSPSLSPSLNLYVLSLQCALEKKYSVPLRNAGVADVSVRQDSRIMVSGGWDGRCINCAIHTPSVTHFLFTEYECLGGRRINPWPFWTTIQLLCNVWALQDPRLCLKTPVS